jgi:hypothetical protein
MPRQDVRRGYKCWTQSPTSREKKRTELELERGGDYPEPGVLI